LLANYVTVVEDRPLMSVCLLYKVYKQRYNFCLS